MIYYFYNSDGLGDNIFNFILLNHLHDFLVQHNNYIYYYCKDSILEQIKSFNFSNKIYIFNLEQKQSKSVLLSIENSAFGDTWSKVVKKSSEKICLNAFYKYRFNIFLKKIKFPYEVSSLYFTIPNVEKLFQSLPAEVKDIDILVLNCPDSLENFNYDESAWNNQIMQLHSAYKVLTTSKVSDNIPCTKEFHLNALDIAVISTKVPVIISIFSEFTPALLNIHTLQNIKRVFLFSSRRNLSYPNFFQAEKLESISLENIDPFLQSSPRFLEKAKANESQKFEEDLEKQRIDKEFREKYSNFEWETYVFLNPDLAFFDKKPATESSAWEHFKSFGHKESRAYNFDWIKYVADNDLQEIVKTRDEAYQHLKKNKNRLLYLHQLTLSDEENYYLKLFDWKFYKEKHSDLRDKVHSHEDALKHYLQFGCREKRKFTDFNWIDYLLLNKDLIDEGIINEDLAIRHWAKHGRYENRKYKK